jgi:hypothetical protein
MFAIGTAITGPALESCLRIGGSSEKELINGLVLSASSLRCLKLRGEEYGLVKKLHPDTRRKGFYGLKLKWF